MIILKSREFGSHDDLTKFINENNIARENIVSIVFSGTSSSFYTLFFYGDSETKEKPRGIWD
jgi:hypothetical protein